MRTSGPQKRAHFLVPPGGPKNGPVFASIFQFSAGRFGAPWDRLATACRSPKRVLFGLRFSIFVGFCSSSSRTKLRGPMRAHVQLCATHLVCQFLDRSVGLENGPETSSFLSAFCKREVGLLTVHLPIYFTKSLEILKWLKIGQICLSRASF